ncbi:MAG: peptidoglycan-binding protein [Cyanobacteria bacterium P01_C01_bin.69]
MSIVVSSVTVSPITPIKSSVLHIGSQGPVVRHLQRNLNARLESLGVISLMSVLVDGSFGQETLGAVKYLQCVGGMPVNGRVDEASWQFIEQGALGLPVLTLNSESTYVTAVQTTVADAGLSLQIDGFYGEQTKAAVEAYQQKMGLMVSGRVGFETWQRIVRSRLTDLPCAALLPNPYQP